MNKNNPLYQEDLNIILNQAGIEQFYNKSFLITGSTGMIGTCLIDALMLLNRRGGNITIYAVGRSKDRAFYRLGEYYDDTHFFFIEQDARQPLPSSKPVDYIIPLASNTHPLAYSQYPIETIEINIKGAENALKRAVECNATVLYPSTVEVYGNAKGEDVFDEDYTGQLNLNNSRSCYTESKRVSEAMCQSYIEEKGAIVKIVRLSRIFGPTMLMSDTKASSQFIIKAINGENIVLKSKGDQFFSYTYVADAVSAMLYVLIHGVNGIPYNISNEKCNVHLKTFACACANAAETSVVFDIPTETEQKGYSVATKAILSNEKLKSIGYKPHYSFDESIDRTIKILKGNERN